LILAIAFFTVGRTLIARISTEAIRNLKDKLTIDNLIVVNEESTLVISSFVIVVHFPLFVEGLL
jgi:hypothetical protein